MHADIRLCRCMYKCNVPRSVHRTNRNFPAIQCYGLQGWTTNVAVLMCRSNDESTFPVGKCTRGHRPVILPADHEDFSFKPLFIPITHSEEPASSNNWLLLIVSGASCYKWQTSKRKCVCRTVDVGSVILTRTYSLVTVLMSRRKSTPSE